MKIKKLIALLLATAMTLSLAACGSSTAKDNDAADKTEVNAEAGNEEKEAEPVTITVGNWSNKDEGDYDVKEASRKAFMDLYPDIIVETDTYQYATDTFLAKAASGELPDVFVTHFTEVDKIINAGYAQDITEAFNNSEYAGHMNDDVLDLLTVDGKVYGVPFEGYSMCLYCNVELFKEAGLVDENGTPIFPTTWEEVAETAATIKEKTGKGGFALPSSGNTGGWLFTNMAWSFGADFEEQVDGKWKAVFDSEETAAAVQYLKDLRWTDDAMPDNCLMSLDDWMNYFASDQVAMGICHIGIANSLVASGGMNKDNIAITAIPEGPAGQTTLMGGTVYMMAAGVSQEKQEAILKWLLYSTASPSVDEESLANYEEKLKGYVEKDYIVGPTGLDVWKDTERGEREQEIVDKYTNVDMRLWNSYCEHKSENLKAEPPVNVQELYAVLDSVIQEVLTNENADCQALLKEAAQNFQSDYLDSAN